VVSFQNSKFSTSDDTMVLTSSYITDDKMPILEVSHEDDEGGGSLWQFHCGNGDYDMSKMLLVRLDTIIALDPEIVNILNISMGQTATRATKSSKWQIR
jgi:hypothetical protein